MIWRGLQKSLARLAVCIIALGAASSFGQYAQQLPYRITISPSDTGVSNYAGVYVLTGVQTTAESSLGGVYQRFVGDQQTPFWITWRTFPASDNLRKYNVGVAVLDTYPTTYNNQGEVLQVNTLNLSAVVVGPNPTFLALSFGNLVVDWFPPSLDPYEDAFPDWASAGVKIPLGFAFAMSFWGVAVAASMGMKWAKDLASAAS